MSKDFRRSRKKVDPLAAAEQFAKRIGRARLRRAMADCARCDAGRNREINAELDPLSEEAWRRIKD